MDLNLNDKMHMKRPTSVTLIALLVLLIGGINFIRLILSLRQWNFLNDLLSVSPIYLTISGAIWFLISLTILWGISRRERWTLSILCLSCVAYTIYYWADRILVTESANILKNNFFAIFITLGLLATILWILSRENVKEYFGAANE